MSASSSQPAPLPLCHQPITTTRPPKHAAAAQVHHAPVALITVTVFIMLVLSALAVTVYMTSQTA
jgi:hypothetical protein